MRALVPTVKKAFEINSDPSTYGTFAEIGAGQEVARHFFVAGHASGTVAKAISAYDMVFSDAIYGKETSGRYVCKSRVTKMIDHEFSQLTERLSSVAHEKRFFAFADTVATNRKHGWMAVRFQITPEGPANDVILHVNMKDNTRLQQTEALGHLGVNLIHACFHKIQNPKDFISSLTDNLSHDRIEIDMIHFEGPSLEHIDNRMMCLELIEQKLTSAVVFDAQGTGIQPGDLLYDQSVFVQRGAFRPVTNVNVQISEAGIKQFEKDFSLTKPPIEVYEITMSYMSSDSHADRKDFLDRVDCLVQLGQPVMISCFNEYHELKTYLRQWTPEPIALVIGGNQLDYFFDEHQCEDLEGGIFEGAARLFDKKTCVYVYPYKTDQICQTTKSFFPPESVIDIYNYLLRKNQIKDLSNCDEVNPSRLASEVRQMILSKDSTWEASVPKKVVQFIREHKLFGVED